MRGIGRIRDSDIRAGYAFPREPGLFHSGVLASVCGGGGGGAEVRVPNIRTVAPSNRESIWQDRGGGALFPSEEYRREVE